MQVAWARGPLFAGVGGFVAMGVWWMPWQAVPMKDVWGRDRPRGAADRALIRGCPNGVTRRLLWAGTAEFCAGGTQGSETSQYLQEEKSIEIPQVAASERGRAQTARIRPYGVAGPE